MCKNSISDVTYVKEKIIKISFKNCYFELLNVTYMRTNFFSQRLYFYNEIRLLCANEFISKRAWEIPKNKNEIFVSVATLAMLAILSKWQADKNFIFANGYSFAVLSIKKFYQNQRKVLDMKNGIDNLCRFNENIITVLLRTHFCAFFIYIIDCCNNHLYH